MIRTRHWIANNPYQVKEYLSQNRFQRKRLKNKFYQSDRRINNEEGA
jgi:hypothetical protein